MYASGGLFDDDNSNVDPYYGKKREADSKLFALENDFEQWRHLLETTNTAKTAKFSTLTQNVKSQIKEVSKMVKDLKKSIDSASGLNSNESQKRRSDVGDISKRVSSMKQMMTSEKTKEKVANDRRELLNSNAAKRSPWDRDEEVSNEVTLTNFRSNQEMIHREQDEVLDDMLGSLKRLGMMGNVIEVELEEQNELLDEIDDDMDHAQSRLDAMTAKLDKILGHSDGKKWCIIMVLVITLGIMIYFMF